MRILLDNNKIPLNNDDDDDDNNKIISNNRVMSQFCKQFWCRTKPHSLTSSFTLNPPNRIFLPTPLFTGDASERSVFELNILPYRKWSI